MWGLLFAIPMAACIKILLDECFSCISNDGPRRTKRSISKAFGRWPCRPGVTVCRVGGIRLEAETYGFHSGRFASRSLCHELQNPGSLVFP
jgi:hypothetical protein